MISSKKHFLTVVFLLLFFIKMDAQSYSPKDIDEMLVSARETMVTNPKKTIDFSKKILRISQDINYERGQDYSQLLLCYGYFYFNKYNLVIRQYNDLEKVASNHSNYEVLAFATIIKATTLNRVKYYTESFEEIEKIKPILKNIESKNTRNLLQGLIYQNLASITNNAYKSRDSVLYYDLLAKKEFEKVVDEKNSSFLMYPKNDLQFGNFAFLGNEFMIKKEYDSVTHYLNKAQKIVPRYNNPLHETLIYNNIGYLLNEKKQYDEALKNYYKSIEISKKYNDLNSLAYAYDGISLCFKDMKDYKNATKYMSMAIDLFQHVTIDEQKAVSTSIDAILKDRESNLKNKNTNLYRIIIISSALTLLSLCLIFFLYKKFRTEKLTKQQVQILLKEKMEQIDKAPQPVYKQSEIIDIKEIINLAIENSPSFYIKFQEIFPDFNEKLLELNPTLVTSELKFAAYIKLDFSTKEIARYTNSSIRGVEAKKYRLRKKLNIPSEDDTNIWMSKI